MADIETFDPIDLELLGRLQDDGSLTIAELAAAVDLSTNAAWRRIKTLEERGLIAKRVALLNYERVGSGLTAFVSIRAAEHSEQWQRDFVRAIDGIPEVVEIYRMTGEADFLLKVRVSDVEAYDRVYKTLIGRINVGDLTTAFSVEEVKFTTAVPLHGR